MNIRKHIGRRVEALRAAKGMTQEELANKAQISRPNISSIENGKYNVRLDTLHKIAEALGVEIELITRR